MPEYNRFINEEIARQIQQKRDANKLAWEETTARLEQKREMNRQLNRQRELERLQALEKARKERELVDEQRRQRLEANRSVVYPIMSGVARIFESLAEERPDIKYSSFRDLSKTDSYIFLRWGNKFEPTDEENEILSWYWQPNAFKRFFKRLQAPPNIVISDYSFIAAHAYTSEDESPTSPLPSDVRKFGSIRFSSGLVGKEFKFSSEDEVRGGEYHSESVVITEETRSLDEVAVPLVVSAYLSPIRVYSSKSKGWDYWREKPQESQHSDDYNTCADGVYDTGTR